MIFIHFPETLSDPSQSVESASKSWWRLYAGQHRNLASCMFLIRTQGANRRKHLVNFFSQYFVSVWFYLCITVKSSTSLSAVQPFMDKTQPLVAGIVHWGGMVHWGGLVCEGILIIHI